MYYLSLGDHSEYSLTHMLKAWDVPSETQYNTLTIVPGGNYDFSLGKSGRS
jgi:hypothetical protein